MTKHIVLGSVEVPLTHYATQANAILGIKGSGKTTTAKGIAEQMLDADIPILVLDPIGMWRYLKVPKAKGGKAYKVVVAGGQAGDLPLTPQTAPEIVRSAIRSNIPLVIDLYDIKLTKADWRRIVKSTCDVLMFENKGIRHVFLEEAAEYVPQIVRDGDVFSSVEKLCRMAGNVSVGITLINPRAQEVNKSVLELCELLILQRQKGKHALDALDKWLSMAQDMKDVAKTIANLGTGEGLVWPEASDPVRTQFPQCLTFHPDRKKPDLPKGSIPEDVSPFVGAMKESLTKVIEEAKANDPAELKKQIAQLKAELAKTQKAPAKPVEVEKRVEVPVFTAEERQMIEDAKNVWSEVRVAHRSYGDLLERLDAIADRVTRVPASKPVVRTAPPVTKPVARTTTPKRQSMESNGELDGTAQRSLNTISMLEVRGITVTREAVARWMGIHPNGGRYLSALAALRTMGHLDGWTLTESGRALAQESATGPDEALNAIKDGTCRRSFEILLAEHPGTLTREQLAEKLGIHPNGGRFLSGLAWLRDMGLISQRSPIQVTNGAFN